MAITIKDVAKKAGVSLSTVSRVINKKGNISEETTKRVENVIEELKYSTNAVTQTLAVNSYRIGILSPRASQMVSEYNKGINIAAIISKIEDMGHIPFVTTVPDIENIEISRIDKILDSNHLDGIISCNYYNTAHLQEYCNSRKIPFICTKGVPPTENISYVDFDETTSAKQLIAYLVSLGHRQFIIAAGTKEQPITQTRLHALLSAAHEFNIGNANFHVYYDHYSIAGGSAIGKEIIAKKINATAIIALSDKIAFGIINTLKDAGYHLPEDFSITGFDNSEMCTLISPTLTTIERQEEYMSDTIINSLIQLINTPSMSQIKILFKSNLIIRGSCIGIK